MSVPVSKHSAAHIDAGPSKAFSGPVTTISEATSEVLPLAKVLPASVSEMGVQNLESLQKPPEPQEPFRLMNLPSEIRNMIFKEFLVMNGPILFHHHLCIKSEDRVDIIDRPRAFVHLGPGDGTDLHGDKIDVEEMQMQRDFLNIFSVSKPIYRETVPIYFGLNTFFFGSLDYLETFTAKVRPDYRWQLARVEVCYWGYRPAKAVKSLLSCVGLRELTLHIESTSTAPSRKPNSDAAQCQLFGMKDLLKVRGLTKLVLKAPWYLYNYGNFAHLDAKTASQEVVNALEARLQVLKQPTDPKTIKRLEKKDFPGNKKRTLFGVANVVTR